MVRSGTRGGHLRAATDLSFKPSYRLTPFVADIGPAVPASEHRPSRRGASCFEVGRYYYLRPSRLRNAGGVFETGGSPGRPIRSDARPRPSLPPPPRSQRAGARPRLPPPRPKFRPPPGPSPGSPRPCSRGAPEGRWRAPGRTLRLRSRPCGKPRRGRWVDMAVKWPVDRFCEWVSTVNPYDGMGAKHVGMGGDIHRKSVFYGRSS